MAGGLSFLGGLFGLFFSAASSNYVPKKTREKRETFSEIFKYEKPTKEVEAVYKKWSVKRGPNQRGEWMYKCGGETLGESQKIWWKHVYEDEGVEVREDYLNYISGICDEKWRTYITTHRRTRK